MKTKRKRTVKPIRSTDNATPKETSKEFPGYPMYSSKDDIMNQAERVDADLDSIKAVQNSPVQPTKLNNKQVKEAPLIDTDEDEEKIARDEFEVTSEDLEALGPEDLSLDMGEDEQLKHRTRPVDFTAKDLDIPGSELDDAEEADGAEDEENNSYSLGGDDHNDLEENKGD